MMFGGISRSNIYIQGVAQISELSFVHESLWTARDFASNANITINTTDENWVKNKHVILTICKKSSSIKFRMSSKSQLHVHVYYHHYHLISPVVYRRVQV